MSEAVLDLNDLAAEMNSSVADIAASVNEAISSSNSAYFFVGDKGEVIDPLASDKTPEWVREHAMEIPAGADGNFAHPYNLKVALRLLANVKSGDTVTTLGKIFPHGSVRRKDGTFRTANVSAETVAHSLCIAIPAFDASTPLGGIESATFVPMSELAETDGDRFVVNSHHMACRIKVNTDKNGKPESFTIMAGCEVAVREPKGKLEDTVWLDASTSVKVTSLSNLAGQAKQLVAALYRMTWVNLYRQSMEVGAKADGDTFHTCLVRLGTNYFGMPFGAADKRNDLRADGETRVITPRVHSRLVGLDDPTGRAHDLPAEYVWKNFSGIFS